jgi:hypothetical protein
MRIRARSRCFGLPEVLRSGSRRYASACRMVGEGQGSRSSLLDRFAWAFASARRRGPHSRIALDWSGGGKAAHLVPDGRLADPRTPRSERDTRRVPGLTPTAGPSGCSLARIPVDPTPRPAARTSPLTTFRLRSGSGSVPLRPAYGISRSFPLVARLSSARCASAASASGKRAAMRTASSPRATAPSTASLRSSSSARVAT